MQDTFFEQILYSFDDLGHYFYSNCLLQFAPSCDVVEQISIRTVLGDYEALARRFENIITFYEVWVVN